MALIYPQNGDLTKLLKSTRKKVPQSGRLSAGGGAKAKRAMPKCPGHEFEWGFPKEPFYNSTVSELWILKVLLAKKSL